MLYKGRLGIPNNSKHKGKYLLEFHASPSGGHSGFFKTYKRITAILYWEGMKGDIRKFVVECSTCQRNKCKALSPAGLLQPLPILDKVWDNISMDFIGGLPRVQQIPILVEIDRLSKYSHFIALSRPYSAKDVADIFVKEIMRLHGFPSSIVSDGDKNFVSHFLDEII